MANKDLYPRRLTHIDPQVILGAKTGVYTHPNAPDKEALATRPLQARAYTKYGYTRKRDIKKDDVNPRLTNNEWRREEIKIDLNSREDYLRQVDTSIYKKGGSINDARNDVNRQQVVNEIVELRKEMKSLGG